MLREMCFPSIFEIYPKTGFYRLPTHTRGTYMKFFLDVFSFLNRNFSQMLFLDHTMQQWVISECDADVPNQYSRPNFFNPLMLLQSSAFFRGSPRMVTESGISLRSPVSKLPKNAVNKHLQ